MLFRSVFVLSCRLLHYRAVAVVSGWSKMKMKTEKVGEVSGGILKSFRAYSVCIEKTPESGLLYRQCSLTLSDVVIGVFNSTLLSSCTTVLSRSSSFRLNFLVL